MEKITITDPMKRLRAIECCRVAPVGSLVEIREGDLHSDLQRKKAHAMLGDIAKQVHWHGMEFEKHIWKRLTVAAMLRECGESPLMIPSLDGHGVDIIYEKTSKFGKKQTGLWIDWMDAFGSEKGVIWSDPKLQREEP